MKAPTTGTWRRMAARTLRRSGGDSSISVSARNTCGPSAANSLLRNDDLARSWRQGVHFAAAEAGVAEHPVEFRKRVGIAVLRGAEHHHAKSGGRGRRHAD